MEPIVLRAVLVLVALVTAAAVGRWWQRRDGAVRAPRADEPTITREELAAVGLDLTGASHGAVLLGSPTCPPCDSVKLVLDALERERGGFRWVYADVADQAEFVDAHRVMRVPTLFLIEPRGRIVARSSGVPRTDDLRRALDDGHLDDDTFDDVAV